MIQNLIAQRDEALAQRRVVDAEITALVSAGFGRGETADKLHARHRELTEVITQCNLAVLRQGIGRLSNE